jgi:hypothetical protein
LLRTVIERHTQMILKMLQVQLQQGLTKSIFSLVGIVSLEKEGIRPVTPLSLWRIILTTL